MSVLCCTNEMTPWSEITVSNVRDCEEANE